MTAAVRTREIATIKILTKQLQMDDTYRAMLQGITGKRSAADLDGSGRKAVIDHLVAKGGVVKAKTKGKPHNFDSDEYFRKIEALLTDMGLSWAYADAIGWRITGGRRAPGVERLAWVRKQEHFTGIVTALMHEKRKRLLAMWPEILRGLNQKGLSLEWARRQFTPDAPPGAIYTLNEWEESLANLHFLQEKIDGYAA